MILDKLSLLVMAQYSKDNLAIWSHCRWPLLPKFSHSSRGKHLWSLSLTLYLTTFLLTHYSNHVVFQLLTLSLCHSYSISIYWSHSHFPCFSIYLSFSLTHFQSHSDTHRHAFYILLATFLQTWRPLLSLSSSTNFLSPFYIVRTHLYLPTYIPLSQLQNTHLPHIFVVNLYLTTLLRICFKEVKNRH